MCDKIAIDPQVWLFLPWDLSDETQLLQCQFYASFNAIVTRKILKYYRRPEKTINIAVLGACGEGYKTHYDWEELGVQQNYY